MTANERTAFPTTTGTSPRSCDRIFTCGEAQIATSPFVYRGVGIFMPEKVGNLQGDYKNSRFTIRDEPMWPMNYVTNRAFSLGLRHAERCIASQQFLYRLASKKLGRLQIEPSKVTVTPLHFTAQ